MILVIDNSPTLDDCTTANIKLNKVGEIIEKEELHWPEYENSDSKRAYHAQVRGLILNEVVRRIDPQVGIFIYFYLPIYIFIILKTRLSWKCLCKSILKVTVADFEELFKYYEAFLLFDFCHRPAGKEMNVPLHNTFDKYSIFMNISGQNHE